MAPSSAAPATATAASTAAATSTTATATATLHSFVDAQRAPAELDPVERRNRGLRRVFVHLHKAKAARTSRLAIVDQAYREYFSMLREQLADVVLCRREREIPDVDALGHCSIPPGCSK